MQRIKAIVGCVQRRPFPAQSGFIVGSWPSIVQTSLKIRKAQKAGEHSSTFLPMYLVVFLSNPESSVTFSASLVVGFSGMPCGVSGSRLVGLLCGVSVNKDA